MQRFVGNYCPVPGVFLGAIPSFVASSTPWTADGLSSEGLTTVVQSKFFRDLTTAPNSEQGGSETGPLLQDSRGQ